MSDTPEQVRKPTIGQRLGHAPLDAEIGKPAININEPNLLAIARAVCENLPPTSFSGARINTSP